MLNQINSNLYMYEIYDEYLERYNQNLINYSLSNGLSIKYFHIKVDESYNFDSEINIHTSFRNFKYDLYHFMPVFDMETFTSQSSFDPSLQGTSYSTTVSMTIVCVDNPVPGDVFHFYDITGQYKIDKTDIFRIKHVHYVRNFNINNDKNNLKIYKVEAESAPFKFNTIEEIEENNILRTYFWDNESGSFIDDDRYEFLIYLRDEKEKKYNLWKEGSYKDPIALLAIKKLYELNNGSTTASYGWYKFNTIMNFYQKNLLESSRSIGICAGPYMKLEIGVFMSFFDLYFKSKNESPIFKDRSFEDQFLKYNDELYSTYQQYLDNLINQIKDEENNPDGVLFQDYEISSDAKETDSSKSLSVLRIKNSEADEEDSEDNEDNEDSEDNFEFIFNENEDDRYESYFDALLGIYKILFSYRLINPNFYDKSIIIPYIENGETLNSINNDVLFYNVDGEVTGPFYETEVNYDPGYVLSYQGGVKYFSPHDGVLSF